MGDAEYEAIVVGAGPAGAVSAGLLAARGVRVLLLDRADFPRRKPCGESVNPGAVRELAELGLLGRVEALPHTRVTRWRVEDAHGHGFHGEFQEGDHGLALDRGRFDGELLAWARERGATASTGERADDLVVEKAVVRGVRMRSGRTYRSHVVIGADGLRSMVVRRLGLLARNPRLRKVAFTAHVRAGRLPEGTGTLQLHPWGCAGIVRIAPGTLNVALVFSAGGMEALGLRGARLFDRVLGEVRGLEQAVRTTEVLATGPFDWPTRRVTADGALLVGDAAGYFDPFTGQGICRALRGARLAAEVVADCLGSGRYLRADLASYERRHRRSVTAGDRLQRWIEAGTARPAVFGASVALLKRSPAAADWLLASVGDLRPPRRASALP